jgi:hypothetical protein
VGRRSASEGNGLSLRAYREERAERPTKTHRFSFYPICVDYPISTSDNNDDDEEENRIDTVVIEITQQQNNMSFNKLTLKNMWK